MHALKAAEASRAALPDLVKLIEYCTVNASLSGGGSLFDHNHCPGMAYATQNGTLAPYPSPTQLLDRFSAEVRAAE